MVHLIQRLKINKYPRDNQKGIDKLFEFDYMGSSEFEWGALPKALKEMRKRTADYSVQSFDAVNTNRGMTFGVHYVGVPATQKEAEELFADQLNDTHKYHLKESSYIDSSYGCGHKMFSTLTCEGWWAIDGQPGWALFKDYYYAVQFLQALQEGTAKGKTTGKGIAV